MPKISIRSTRRLEQQQLIATLLANNCRRIGGPLSPGSERNRRDAAKILSSSSIASLKMRLREVSFEESLAHSTSSSSEATLDSIINGSSDSTRDRDRNGSSSLVSPSSLRSRKRGRCSLQSLSPSVCLSSLADNSSSSDKLGDSSLNHGHETLTPKRRESSSTGGWGHFVDVIPPDNEHADGASSLADVWSQFKQQQRPRSLSLPAHMPYTLNRQEHFLCSSRNCLKGARHPPTSPEGSPIISSKRSETPIQENCNVEKALSVMKIS
uniref:Uncharacterized protein n=1 Tax=Ditylum brightwellii TaxID=49249 RepID=A0A6V2PJZ7_9STRA|mmetsp:Transcript_21506/g.28286  ORF Transcript_21506/g.28286 Transcript_21506/m.28286 type:complete len:268 (-) Transcript_21506:210-1013(-)